MKSRYDEENERVYWKPSRESLMGINNLKGVAMQVGCFRLLSACADLQFLLPRGQVARGCTEGGGGAFDYR